jgi:hypothetical protein
MRLSWVILILLVVGLMIFCVRCGNEALLVLFAIDRAYMDGQNTEVGSGVPTATGRGIWQPGRCVA